MDIHYTQQAHAAYERMLTICRQYRHELIVPEHLLLSLLEQEGFAETLQVYGGDLKQISKELLDYMNTIEKLPDDKADEMEVSALLSQVFQSAFQSVEFSSAEALDIPHLVRGLLKLEDSLAAYLLHRAIGDSEQEFMVYLISRYEEIAEEQKDDETDEMGNSAQKEPWRKLVTCLNDHLERHNVLIGREDELERTIQVLCRKEKNNPLHVGEPGVGKTALVYGLARRIEEGSVPPRLQGCRIYQLDLGTMLSGTQFRGDFEKRIQDVMKGIGKEGNAIVYIDEIHNLVGAGAVGESSMDASNMLKPYLESGNIRFIGSTTYEEFNRFFSRSKGLVRRFQQIDIAEPSVEEAIGILKGLKEDYEKFHQVVFDDDAIDFAVRASAKYVNDRFLPDKAIDLIDEAGAWRENHPEPNVEVQRVDKKLIKEVLARTCKVEAMADADDDAERLSSLETRIKAKIYGQDEAVRQVVEAVQMSKAGLLEADKPLASLLFVGPTGVGKTEVAKVLSRELGIGLVRFDMSEYTEKHTVAKLIGSPAGYVGYEDGGLLTDAIRKTPNCVLLLDEIEKAHQDIYNILLQVMDYARLTDNKGRKADFRNVILIMTSNAGAQYASQANVGFNAKVSRGEAMLAQAKKTFKPEFINRLSGTVVFNDMDKPMATLILQKKLDELAEKLTSRHVTMQLDADVYARLLEQGFTHEYGAREMDRVIASELKPLLMREILFGRLKQGGEAHIGIKDNQITIL